MSISITLIPGDGIGPEVTQATRAVVDAALDVDWELQEAGLKAVEKTGVPVPAATIESIRQNQVALKGPTTTPIGTGHKSANVLIRQALNLYACIRPIKTIPGIVTPYPNVDIFIVRENTEGLYSGQELLVTPETAVSLKVVTKQASLQISEAAFSLARARNRKKITVGHKANILKIGDGLFLDCARAVGLNNPDIALEDVLIDALCMKIVVDPGRFDVLLVENLYGDILSDLCAGLVGGLGLAAGANIGKDAAVFEAVHGSAPDIAGKNCANPSALIKSAVLMLEHMGERSAAERISGALDKTLLLAKVRTPDLGGKHTTTEFARAVISAM